MSTPINTFTVVDARTLDGDPYEVALAAVDQALALTELAVEYTDIAARMGRNAQDERDLYFTGAIGETEYVFTGEGKNFEKAKEGLAEATKRLASLRKAVGFNPKARTSK